MTSTTLPPIIRPHLIAVPRIGANLPSRMEPDEVEAEEPDTDDRQTGKDEQEIETLLEALRRRVSSRSGSGADSGGSGDHDKSVVASERPRVAVYITEEVHGRLRMLIAKLGIKYKVRDLADEGVRLYVERLEQELEAEESGETGGAR
jgi:hypothetical protein